MVPIQMTVPMEIQEAQFIQMELQANQAIPAVQEIQHNLRTGSVLICYDEKLLPMARIEALSAQLLELRDLCLHYAPRKKPVILERIAGISRSFAES